MKYQVALICLTLFVAPAFSQESSMDQETKEHLEWLTKFVGEWNVEHQGGAGTLSCSMLGKYWLINNLEMGAQGTSVRAIQTIGYDPKEKQYVGTWVDSMNGYLWHYTGQVDESGNKLVLDAKGPDMTDPSKTANYRDAYEFKSPDHIHATASVQGDDGKWTTFMSSDAYRDKKDG